VPKLGTGAEQEARSSSLLHSFSHLFVTFLPFVVKPRAIKAE
jgi:hypothetical protein